MITVYVRDLVGKALGTLILSSPPQRGDVIYGWGRATDHRHGRKTEVKEVSHEYYQENISGEPMFKTVITIGYRSV